MRVRSQGQVWEQVSTVILQHCPRLEGVPPIHAPELAWLVGHLSPCCSLSGAITGMSQAWGKGSRGGWEDGEVEGGRSIRGRPEVGREPPV